MIARFLASKFSGYIAIAAVFFIIGTYFYVKHIGFKECQNEVIIKEIEVLKKRSEIAANRPDDTATIDRLLSGTF